MEQLTRLAVYYAPRPGAFAACAAEWLGWDMAAGQALAHTAEGLELHLPAGPARVGDKALAVLRPSDFTLTDHGIAASITKAVYLGSDLHLFAQPALGGPEIRITARDGAKAPQVGQAVHLAYDPKAVHLLEVA